MAFCWEVRGYQGLVKRKPAATDTQSKNALYTADDVPVLQGAVSVDSSSAGPLWVGLDYKQGWLSAIPRIWGSGVDNGVNNHWTGQPTRIYLLDKRGRVVYNLGMGPYASNSDYLEAVLNRVLATIDDN